MAVCSSRHSNYQAQQQPHCHRDTRKFFERPPLLFICHSSAKAMDSTNNPTTKTSTRQAASSKVLKIPKVLLVGNQEARSLALEYYTLSCETNDTPPVYVDLEIDILAFDSRTTLTKYVTKFRSSSPLDPSIRQSGALTQLKHLAVEPHLSESLIDTHTFQGP
ncbi:hypothetical protein BDZ45DRAFT_313344 [Acephala macrosclerotiorum]|nr:hypothetical protein BDZ45DRAFT_313344 [Acephala macrosclerotiorum]